ncbi:hypothetical protein BHM03_00059484, partial [Ensete ventricosum]
VSKLGFGCMGLTGVYNSPVSDEAGISIIKHAFNNGITFFDTADVYGPHANEILLGKVWVLPLPLACEAGPDTIRRAHMVHPISALQMEWSLWTREIEKEIVPLCRELGIGIVPYSPLGRGFFGGRGVTEKTKFWTTKLRNLDDNIGSLKVKLTEDDLKEISDAVREEEVAGYRSHRSFESVTWKYTNTPPMHTDLPA